jgi:hypothetical protein
MLKNIFFFLLLFYLNPTFAVILYRTGDSTIDVLGPFLTTDGVASSRIKVDFVTKKERIIETRKLKCGTTIFSSTDATFETMDPNTLKYSIEKLPDEINVDALKLSENEREINLLLNKLLCEAAWKYK